MSADRVIVVGAGPVGLVTAYGLARAGIPVTVLEAEEQVIDSPRAMVYHWALHGDLHRLGLLEEIERRGFRRMTTATGCMPPVRWSPTTWTPWSATRRSRTTSTSARLSCARSCWSVWLGCRTPPSAGGRG